MLALAVTMATNNNSHRPPNDYQKLSVLLYKYFDVFYAWLVLNTTVIGYTMNLIQSQTQHILALYGDAWLLILF